MSLVYMCCVVPCSLLDSSVLLLLSCHDAVTHLFADCVRSAYMASSKQYC
jgi:hypothetical protein